MDVETQNRIEELKARQHQEDLSFREKAEAAEEYEKVCDEHNLNPLSPFVEKMEEDDGRARTPMDHGVYDNLWRKRSEYQRTLTLPPPMTSDEMKELKDKMKDPGNVDMICDYMVKLISHGDKLMNPFTGQTYTKGQIEACFNHLKKFETEIVTKSGVIIVKDSYKYLMDGVLTLEGFTYEPGLEDPFPYVPIRDSKGNQTSHKNYHYNKWCSPDNTFIEGVEEKDVQPFVELVRYLADGKEHHFKLIMMWLAATVCYPGVKLKFALMIMSGQGVGKSTLLENVIRPLVGPTNVNEADPNDIGARFANYWAECVVAFFDETYGSDGNGKGLTPDNLNASLRAYITQESGMIERKGGAKYGAKNCANFLLFTNEQNVLKVTEGERRYYIIRHSSLNRTKEEIRKMVSESYWNVEGFDNFYTWLPKESSHNHDLVYSYLKSVWEPEVLNSKMLDGFCPVDLYDANTDTKVIIDSQKFPNELAFESIVNGEFSSSAWDRGIFTPMEFMSDIKEAAEVLGVSERIRDNWSFGMFQDKLIQADWESKPVGYTDKRGKKHTTRFWVAARIDRLDNDMKLSAVDWSFDKAYQEMGR